MSSPIKITLEFGSLFCFRGADQGSDFAGDSSEPYLWTIMVAFDGAAITQSGTTFVGSPRFFTSAGSHGNLNLGSGIEAGQTAPIPAGIGSWATTLQPILVTDQSGATIEVPGQVAMIGILMEQNDTPNDAMEAGHAALNSFVENQLTSFVNGIDLISVGASVLQLMNATPGLSEADAAAKVFGDLLTPVQNDIMAKAPDVVTTAVKNELNVLGDIGSILHPDEADGQCFRVFNGSDLAVTTVDTPVTFVNFLTGDESPVPAWGYNIHGSVFRPIRVWYTPIPDSVPAGDWQVFCVDKTVIAGAPKVSWLSHIGGVLDDGTPWRLSRSNAISLINSGVNKFFVEGSDRSRADVQVVMNDPKVGHPYLRTHADQSLRDNLDSLPSPCPAFITHSEDVG